MSYFTVYSTSAAWSKANEIFPTDYLQDAKASENAGYPVYWSTASGINAWISDLGDRLEVNLPTGESVNIWIETPEQVEVLDVMADKVDENKYTVKTASGYNIDVETNVIHNGIMWPYKVGGQLFSRWDWAKKYLLSRMQELQAGVRYLPRRHKIPDICGVNGSACRNSKCNSALCMHCPIAEQHDADRDGVRIEYLQ